MTDSFAPHITRAQGYLELGMFQDAHDELEQIQPELRTTPAVLALKLRIYRALEKWELMQAVARRLSIDDPDDERWAVSWAYATRQAYSIEAARIILLEAVERLPRSSAVQYDLACYECLLGEVEVAKARLRHAVNLSPELRLTALEDEDLEPLWASLSGKLEDHHQ